MPAKYDSKVHYLGCGFFFHHVESHTNFRGAAGASECSQGSRMQRMQMV